MSAFVLQYLHLPKKEDVNINFRSYWNAGVFYTFDFVANLPSKVVSLKDYAMDFASSPPADKQDEQPGKAEESKAVPEAAAPPPATEAPSSQDKATGET